MSDLEEPPSPRPENSIRIAVVGPCSSGKSVLARALVAAGYEVRQPAQEHSYVAAMWQRLSRPDLLIFLDVDYDNVRQRRPHSDGGPARLAEQQQKLAHARQHCDFYVDTSGLTPEQVQKEVFGFLRQAT